MVWLCVVVGGGGGDAVQGSAGSADGSEKWTEQNTRFP